MEVYLKETHSDPENKLPLGENPEIGRVEPPTIMIDTNEPTWKEVQDMVKKARAASPQVPVVYLIRCIKNAQSPSSSYGSYFGGAGKMAPYHGRGQNGVLSQKRKPQ